LKAVFKIIDRVLPQQASSILIQGRLEGVGEGEKSNHETRSFSILQIKYYQVAKYQYKKIH
jgi:hypothetical protein